MTRSPIAGHSSRISRSHYGVRPHSGNAAKHTPGPAAPTRGIPHEFTNELMRLAGRYAELFTLQASAYVD
jgi:hypothetical protein